MSDFSSFAYGGAHYPLTASTANSLLEDADPAIYYALLFFKQILVTHIGGRLVAEAAACNAPITSAVAQVVPFDPKPVLTQDQFKFPLLAIFRTSALYPRHSIALPQDVDTWTVLWILPPLTAGQMERILPIRKAVSAVLSDRIVQGMDPTYAGGMPWWVQAQIKSTDLKSSKFGRLEDLAGDVFFPAWEAQLEIKERKMPIAGQYQRLAGVDGGIVLSDTITGTQTQAVASFATDSPPTIASQIPNCQLWLRADQDVAQAAGTVFAWADRSGNNLLASPVGAPRLGAGPNGHPCIALDGVTQALTIPANGVLRPTTGVTLFAVYRARGALASHQGILACQSGTSFNDGYALMQGPTLTAGDVEFYVNAYAAKFGGGGGTDLGTWYCAIGVYDKTNVTLYLNGVQVGSQTAYAANIAYTTSPQFVIGATNGSSSLTGFAPIDLAEAGMYSRALTTTELATLTTMLMDHYALLP